MGYSYRVKEALEASVFLLYQQLDVSLQSE